MTKAKDDVDSGQLAIRKFFMHYLLSGVFVFVMSIPETIDDSIINLFHHDAAISWIVTLELARSTTKNHLNTLDCKTKVKQILLLSKEWNLETMHASGDRSSLLCPCLCKIRCIFGQVQLQVQQLLNLRRFEALEIF